MLAWHFLNDEGLLRDGTSPPNDGEWLEHTGPVEICKSGLHASRHLIDALEYAPGSILCRVEMGEVIDQQFDKIVSSRRKIIWRKDVSDILIHFARREALGVAHLWACPPIVLQYLQTGDPSIRAAAHVAARATTEGREDAKWAAKMAARWATEGREDAKWAASWAVWSVAWNVRDAEWPTAMDAGGVARSRQNRRLTAMVTR
jgi:hypothetical protein